MRAKPKVSIIVLTFNSISKLGKFFDKVLTSLFNVQYSNIDILFVDNNSQDETIGYLKRFISESGSLRNIKILQLRKNYGWAGGNNRGALLCKDSDYLLFMNDDVILEPDTITELVNYLETNVRIGAAQPAIINVDGTSYCGFELGFGGFAHPIILKHNNVPGIIDIFYAMGAALITRAKLFFKIGMFDEDYFFWYDDVDYCWRVRSNGFRVVCILSTRVYHYGSMTLGKRNPLLNYYWIRNNLWMCIKNYSLWNFILTTPMRLGEALIGGLGHNLMHKNVLGIKFFMKGLIDGIRGLPLFLLKKSYVTRKVYDQQVIKSMNPYIDIKLLTGWMFKRCKQGSLR